MSSITPTIGRKVYYFEGTPQNALGGNANAAIYNPAAPFDATVVYVRSDTCVNLSIRDHNGSSYARTSVQLQDPQEGDAHGGFCYATWTPYQVGQAKKAEAA